MKSSHYFLAQLIDPSAELRLQADEISESAWAPLDRAIELAPFPDMQQALRDADACAEACLPSA